MVIHKKDGVIRGQFLRSGGIITAGLIFAPRERQFSDDQLKLIIERD